VQRGGRGGGEGDATPVPPFGPPTSTPCTPSLHPTPYVIQGGPLLLHTAPQSGETPHHRPSSVLTGLAAAVSGAEASKPRTTRLPRCPRSEQHPRGTGVADLSAAASLAAHVGAVCLQDNMFCASAVLLVRQFGVDTEQCCEACRPAYPCF